MQHREQGDHLKLARHWQKKKNARTQASKAATEQKKPAETNVV